MNKLDASVARYIPDSYTVRQDGNAFLFDVPAEDLVRICVALHAEHGLSLKTITALDRRQGGEGFRVLYVFGVPKENIFIIPTITLRDGDSFPSITPFIHEASGYERKIHSFFGLKADGHPSLAQMILHENWPEKVYPLRKDFAWNTRPAEAHGTYTFQKLEGEGIYEIPVGPVHAGIIEPGHFRFSVAGEEILLLEPRLGYKHKGTEKLFENRSIEEGIRLSERVSGDTSFTHSLAFCQAIERIADVEVSKRAMYMRVIFSELERLANHFNDAGFIMLDTGFSFGGSQCGRLRERVMQMNERLTGSRFLRGVNAFGGIRCDIDASSRDFLIKELEALQKDFAEVIRISLGSASLENRLAGTGKLDQQIALDHGIVGVAGRAVGIAHDARLEYPYAVYDKLPFEMALEKEGDVRARWHVRVKEVSSSISMTLQACADMPATGKMLWDKEIVLPQGKMGIGITEGWRGDIVYVVVAGAENRLERVDVRDPSFLNWNVVGHAGKGNIVPDFPLINKSFDLSYSGYDL